MMNTWRLGRWIGAVCWLATAYLVATDAGVAVWLRTGMVIVAVIVAVALVRP